MTEGDSIVVARDGGGGIGRGVGWMLPLPLLLGHQCSYSVVIIFLWSASLLFVLCSILTTLLVAIFYYYLFPIVHCYFSP